MIHYRNKGKYNRIMRNDGLWYENVFHLQHGNENHRGAEYYESHFLHKMKEKCQEGIRLYIFSNLVSPYKGRTLLLNDGNIIPTVKCIFSFSIYY